MRAPYRQPRPGSNPVVAGRKFCPTCGRWRLALDFSAQRRDADGEVLTLSAECRTCARVRQREALVLSPLWRQHRTEASRRSHERKRREAGIPPRSSSIVLGRKFCSRCGRWRPVSDYSASKAHDGRLAAACQACLRIDARRRAARRRAADPDWIELRREYNRFYGEAKRREAGVPERDWREDSGRGGGRYPNGRGGTLPPEPLVAAIDEHWGDDWEGLGLSAGVPSRRLWGIRHGERISVSLADRLTMTIGLGLELVYDGEGVPT